MKLKCMCCGFEGEFRDGEEAFRAGWDAPPHFTGYVTCNLCPAVCIVLGLSHEKAHAYWREHGREKEFNRLCATDEKWGWTQEQYDEEVDKGRRLVEALRARMNN